MGCPGQARTKPRRKNQPSQQSTGNHVGQRPRPPPCSVRRSAARLPQRVWRMALDTSTSGATSIGRSHKVVRETSNNRRGRGRHHVACGARPHACRNECGAWRWIHQRVEQRPSADRTRLCARPATIDRPPCEKEAPSDRQSDAAMRGRERAITRGCWAAAHGGGRRLRFHKATVDRQSGPRPDSRHLRQPALEGLTNSARTETPRQADRNKSDQRTQRRGGGTWAAARPREGARGEGGRVVYGG
ncbi:eukaryotic translation initiation factor 3 subunit A [Dorcoceras hygrometricum]|nr:eukaryotic translation initiation factor 3 subunit A [Dorcoceras hygrometricum]